MSRGFWIYGVLLVAIQGLAACGNNPVEDEPIEMAAGEQGGGEKLVVAFGDSLFAGYQLAPNEGLAPQLQAALKEDGINAREPLPSIATSRSPLV